MKTLLGDCRDEDLIDDLFGDINYFACLVEEHGNNFRYGKIIVEYDEELDIHYFYHE